jgi:hypothetical protein
LNYSLSSNAGVSLTGVNAITVSSGTNGTAIINLANIGTGSLLFPSAQSLTITNDGSGLLPLAIGPNTVIGSPGLGGVVFAGSGTTTFNGSFAILPNQVRGGLGQEWSWDCGVEWQRQ